MPFRNYKCEAGHSYEIMEPIKNDIQTVCQEDGCPAPVGIDFSKCTGIRVTWKSGAPTPKYGD